MRCSNCGTRNAKKYKFCKECGEELAAAAPRQAVAPPQQTVVIIKEEKQRRGVPALIWILVGMILVVLLCGLLVWLDFVDVPDQIRVVLPDPIGDLVDAVDDARPPGAPDLPGGVAQDEPVPGWEVPQVGGEADQGSDACNEDINFIIGGNHFDAPVPFSRDATGRFTSADPFENEDYDLYLTRGGITQGPMPCEVKPMAGRSVLFCDEYIQFEAGEWMTLIFKPRGEDCEVGRLQISQTCQSGSLYRDGWPYNNGCCTHGCWCDDGAGHMGCWQTCAPACAE